MNREPSRAIALQRTEMTSRGAKSSFIVVCLVQAIAGVGWTVWLVFSEEGWRQYVGLIPAAVLVVGAVVPVLALRLRAEKLEVAAELQRLKTLDRLEEKLQTTKERLEHFEMLREWGLITEQEFQEKRRSLLDLEGPTPAQHDSGRSGRVPMQDAGARTGNLKLVHRDPRSDPYASSRPKRLRKSRNNQESGG
jgi:hypothetical protein